MFALRPSTPVPAGARSRKSTGIPTPKSKFPLGEILVTARYLGLLGITNDEIISALRRHADGDFGVFGRLEDATIDDDSRWCPVLRSRLVQNAVSIEAGEGIAQSSYPFPVLPDRGHGNSPGPRRGSNDRLQVATILVGGQAKTLITPARDISFFLRNCEDNDTGTGEPITSPCFL